jgi:hypothetical protein
MNVKRGLNSFSVEHFFLFFEAGFKFESENSAAVNEARREKSSFLEECK